LRSDLKDSYYDSVLLCTKNPRVDRVLTSAHISTKIFAGGDYKFPVEEDAAPGYIEVCGVNFNTTHRITSAPDAITGSRASGGRSGNRRNIFLKSSPSKPRGNSGGATQSASKPAAGPSTPQNQRYGFPAPEFQATPDSCSTVTASRGLSFALGEFGTDPETDIGGPKRSLDCTNSQDQVPKRPRKPRAKGKEQEGDAL
jgi:hypothetical protein